MKRLLLLTALFSTLVLSAKPPIIYSLPMQGNTTLSTMSIWAMVPQKNNYTYSFINEQTEIVGNISFSDKNCWKHICPVTISFEGLQQDKDYQLLIKSEQDSLLLSKKYQAFPNYDPDRPLDFTVLAGSCFMRGTDGITDLVDNRAADPIYKSMKEVRADLMLWLGDNLYYLYEYHSEKGMLRKNIATRMLPEIQGITATKAHYSIWDDHEFGSNDSDGSFSKKEITSRIFKAFWPNPPYAQDNNTTYYQFSYQDADFFMLDDRYFSKRSPTPGTHSIIDSIQINWLEEELKQSSATFKILCLGSQWFNDKRKGSKDIFAGSEGSAEFLQFLKDSNISGLVLISGDVHYGMLQKIPREGTYPLYELTSSAVSSWPNKGPLKWPGSVSSFVVPGTLYTGNNYSVLQFTGDAGHRTLTISTYNVDGKIVWQQNIRQEDLQ